MLAPATVARLQACSPSLIFVYITISILSQSHVLFDLAVGTQKRFGVGWDVVNIILFYINEIFVLCYLLNVEAISCIYIAPAPFSFAKILIPRTTQLFVHNGVIILLLRGLLYRQ